MSNSEADKKPNIIPAPQIVECITTQDITKGQKVAPNKNGTVRRTNRKALAIGEAVTVGKKGGKVQVGLYYRIPVFVVPLSHAGLFKK